MPTGEIRQGYKGGPAGEPGGISPPGGSGSAGE